MARRGLEPGERGEVTYAVNPKGGQIAKVLICDAVDGVRRRVTASGPTKGAALRALEDVLKRRTGPAGRGELTGESRVWELLTIWSEQLDRRPLADGTRLDYRGAAALVCAELRPAPDPARVKHVSRSKRDRDALPGIGEFRIRQVTPKRLSELLDAVVDRHGVVRAKWVGVVMTAAFDIAVRYGAAPHNVARLVPPVRKAPTPDVRALSADELPALLADLRGDLKAVAADLPRAIELLYLTGLRTGELFALRWEDLDLGEAPTVTVSGTVVRHGGLRRQDHPKTRTSRRRVRISQSTAAWLMERQVNSGTEWVMPSSAGSMRDPGNFRRAWRDFTGRRPEWEWVKPGTMRKTTATVIRDRLTINEASHQLGHSGIRVTEASYAERVRMGPDVADLLGELLTGPAEQKSE